MLHYFYLLFLRRQRQVEVFKIGGGDTLLTGRVSEIEHGGITDALHVENHVPLLLLIAVCDPRPILIQRDKSLLNSNLYIDLHLSSVFSVIIIDGVKIQIFFGTRNEMLPKVQNFDRFGSVLSLPYICRHSPDSDHSAS